MLLPNSSVSRADGKNRARQPGTRAQFGKSPGPFAAPGRATQVAAANREPIVQYEGPIVSLGAFALFALLFLSFGRLTDFFLDYLHLPFVISVVCVITAIMNRNLLVAFKSPVGIALTLFSLWLVVDIPFSFWRSNSLELVSDDWAKSFGLFVVTAALLPSLRQCTRAVKVLAFAFLTTSLLGLVYGTLAQGRFALTQGLYMGSNELATAMAQGCVFWLFMMRNPAHSFPKRILSAIPLIPLLIILTDTASRAGLVVIGVVAVMTFFHSSAGGKAAIAAALVLSVAAGLIFMPATSRQRFATIFGGDPAQVEDDAEASGISASAVASATQRAFLLKRSITLTFEHPLFGVGPGQFPVAEAGLSQDEGKPGLWLGTHNTYTQISSEGGIPALLLFVASLYFCWRELSAAEKIHRNNPHPNSAGYLAVAYTLRLALISYVVFFCFEHIGYGPFYPAVAGLIVAFSRASRAMASEQPIRLAPAAAVMRPPVRAVR